MNKTELINVITKRTHMTKKDAEKVLTTFAAVVADELAGGGKVQISGFGTFEASERAARKGRNPHTGEKIEIPATRVPKFKAGKELKAAVKKG